MRNIFLLLFFLVVFSGAYSQQKIGGRNAYRLSAKPAYPGFSKQISDTTKWYFANSGNDANSGHSIALAKQTLNELNSLEFEPNDDIYLNRGDNFNDTLIININGTSGNNINYGTYGSGDNPSIDYYWNKYNFSYITISDIDIGTTINTMISNEGFYMVTNEGDIMIENY